MELADLIFFFKKNSPSSDPVYPNGGFVPSVILIVLRHFLSTCDGIPVVTEKIEKFLEKGHVSSKIG